jgi:CubicO group peptidase (beta-lactamase class C family)
MKTLPCLILLTAGLSCAAPASAADRLPELLTRTAANLPAGGSVLTEIDHEAVRHTTFGPAHSDPDLPPESVLFEIGSITKVFTGLLLAQAVLEERLQLDDPIGPLLPASLDLAPEVAGITLRQLATHTSGLPRLPDNFDPANPFDPYADYGIDPLHAYLRDYRPVSAGPHLAAYSNLGTGLLGHLLERVYGQSYADLTLHQNNRDMRASRVEE